MSVAQYIGRQVDLLAYDGDLTGGRTPLLMRLAAEDHGGKVTTGLQQLAQRLLVELFTIRGSMVHFPERGCDFLAQAMRGEFRTPLDVFAGFASALLDIRQQLLLQETEDDPLDERFEDAELTKVELSASTGMRLWISIKSRAPAGSATYVVPLAISV